MLLIISYLSLSVNGLVFFCVVIKKLKQGIDTVTDEDFVAMAQHGLGHLRDAVGVGDKVI